MVRIAKKVKLLWTRCDRWASLAAGETRPRLPQPKGRIRNQFWVPSLSQQFWPTTFFLPSKCYIWKEWENWAGFESDWKFIVSELRKTSEIKCLYIISFSFADLYIKIVLLYLNDMQQCIMDVLVSSTFINIIWYFANIQQILNIQCTQSQKIHLPLWRHQL